MYPIEKNLNFGGAFAPPRSNVAPPLDVRVDIKQLDKFKAHLEIPESHCKSLDILKGDFKNEDYDVEK